jgi:hypothetical protein
MDAGRQQAEQVHDVLPFDPALVAEVGLHLAELGMSRGLRWTGLDILIVECGDSASLQNMLCACDFVIENCALGWVDWS